MALEGVDVSWVGGVFQTLLYVFMYVMIGILIAAMFGAYWYFMIYRKKVYNIDCILIVKRKGVPVVAYDRGGFVTKKKLSKFRLMRRKQARIVPPLYEHLMVNEKGRSTLFLYKYGEQDYVTLDPVLAKEVLNLNPVEGLSKDAVVQDIREILIDLDKPSMFEKWAVPAVMIIAVLIIMAGTYFSVSVLAKAMTSNGAAYLESARLLSEAMERAGSIAGVG